MMPAAPTHLAWLTARPIAHRGLHDGNQKCWENTLTAFEHAIAGDFSIECDVTLAADGVPMVFHDHDLKRLTGDDGQVHEIASGTLCEIAVGGTTDRIPRLADALSLVGGQVPLVIELKGKENHDDGMVAAVADALRGYSGKAAVMSFDHHLVRQFASQAPGIPAGLTAEGNDDAAMEAHFSMLAHDISFASYDVGGLPNRFVKFLRDRLRLPFITWTVRDRAAAELTWTEGGQITFEGFDPGAL